MTNLQRTSAEWAATLRKNRIKPTRSMGQNFLTSTEVVEEIVAISGVQPGDLVIEIGPGMGILTRQLLTAGARVIGALVRELKRRGGGLGCAAICSGGGQGDAILVEV